MSFSIKGCYNFVQKEGLLSVVAGGVGILGAYVIKQIFVGAANPLSYGSFAAICAFVAFVAHKSFKDQISLKIILGMTAGFMITNLYLPKMTIIQTSITSGIIAFIAGVSIAYLISKKQSEPQKASSNVEDMKT